VEVDEMQHFTSFRSATLGDYPTDVTVGFEVGEYRALCRRWSPTADRYRFRKEARGFGVGGRQRQRAYYDALRDLAVVAMGQRPLLRIAAAEADAVMAYARARGVLLDTLGG